MSNQIVELKQEGKRERESNGPSQDHQKNDGRRGGRGGRGRGGGGGGGGHGGGLDMKMKNDVKPLFQREEGRELREIPLREGGMGNRGGRSGRGRVGGGGANRDSRSNDNPFLNERILKMISGPTTDLPPAELKERKFNNKCRLYLGNLSPDTTEEEFKSLFAPYGEINEVFINKEKQFAFVRLDYKSTAEKAKRELDGHSFKGRNIKVRFAPLGSTIKVKNLSGFVTNELLELGFSVFGDIERAIVNVDDRGNSLKEGVVEFTRKGSALSALRYCLENCFFLTSSLKPVIVEPYETTEDNDGYSEKMVTKKNQDFYQAREVGPRFAKFGSFEHEFGTRWKQIYELYKQKEEALKRELKLEEEKLEAQLQYAKYEHETELLREQLRQREMDRERQKREWEMKERQAEEQRVAEEEAFRRQQEDVSRRMVLQEDEMRRRQQENSLFMQDQGMRANYGGDSLRMEYEALEGAGGRKPDGYPDNYDRGFNGRPGEEMAARRGGGGGGAAPGGNTNASPNQGGGPPRWHNQDRNPRQDEYPSKRRRY